MESGEAQRGDGLPRWAWGVLLSGVLFLLMLPLQVGERSPLRRFGELLELKGFDTMFLLREQLAPTTADPRIRVVVIDDEGQEMFENGSQLVELGHDSPYPWPRAWYGDLALRLHEAGARAVFFDFLFSSPSVWDGTGELIQDSGGSLPGLELEEEQGGGFFPGGGEEESFGFDESPPAPGDDQLFAEACRATGITFLSMFAAEPDRTGRSREEAVLSPATEESQRELERMRERRLDAYPDEVLQSTALPGELVVPRSYGHINLPLPELVSATRGSGVINAEKDPDGVIRRVRPLYEVDGRVFPAATLLLAQELLGGEVSTPDGSTLGLGSRRYPLDPGGSLVINFHGGTQTYPYEQFHAQLLEHWRGEEPDADLEGCIFLVGTSAVGLGDVKASPFGNYYPGVEAHAAALDNFLNEDFLYRPGLGPRLGWLALLLLVGGQLFARSRSAGAGVVVLVVLFFLQVGLGFGLFAGAGIWVDQVVPVMGLGGIFAGAQTVHYFTEGRKKKAIRGAFQRYLPPSVVDEVLKVPLDELKLGGDRRELTVSFSDIRGFTGISEQLGPEELVSMLNVYLGEMTDIISRRHGTLDKYIGDSIMAFWGAPLAIEQPAVEACLSALENHERLEVLREEFRAQGLPELHARIGINTGVMLVGNMGSERHFSYTVMGDAVNLASRLEGAGKQYGVSILIGSRTREEAREYIEVREIDLLRVKGKEEPERVFELLARRGELSPERARLRESYEEGLTLYQGREFGAASGAFQRALELDPEDGPSRVYLERSLLYTEQPPPPDWDGVFVMTSK